MLHSAQLDQVTVTKPLSNIVSHTQFKLLPKKHLGVTVFSEVDDDCREKDD